MPKGVYQRKPGLYQKQIEIMRRINLGGGGENHHAWKGDSITYSRLHHWINEKKGKAARCILCGKTKGQIDWANIDGKYRRDVSDYIELCRGCHIHFDYIHRKIAEYRRAVITNEKTE